MVVGQYFEKRRTLANGIAFSGSGLGMFAMTPLITALLQRFGRQGALFVMGAIMLNVCICGMLFRFVIASVSSSCDMFPEFIHKHGSK